MDLGLRDRVALVAAASTGLGRATAERLAMEGARLTICARSQQTLETAAAEIRASSGNEVFPVLCDVTNEAEVHRLVEVTVERYGRLDVLVTNAGGPPSGGFAEFSGGLEPYRRALELNLLSTVALTQAAVPEMRKNGWGRVIAVTSLAAKQPSTSLLLSSVARAGVLAFTKVLATELARENITVNSVCPGFTLTERLLELAVAESDRGGVTTEEIYERWRSDIPARRIADPNEFADVVAFLASERASYVTGVALAIDGGIIKSLY